MLNTVAAPIFVPNIDSIFSAGANDTLDISNAELKSFDLKAVLPKGHPLTKCKNIAVSQLCGEPFIMLEKGSKSEINKLFETHGIKPNVKFTTWDDYAVMSMVEKGLGIGILPGLILKRNAYDIAIKDLSVPAYRDICVGVRNKKSLPIAVKKFLDYLPYRNG